MRKIPTTVLAACIGLAASTTVAGAGLFSATGSVIAILADDLFVGEADGHLSGAGTLAIHSQKNPDLICLGDFTSRALLGSSGQMNRSDGTAATSYFQRLSVLRGFGTGRFSRGSKNFGYGLTAEEARPYLKLPKGKKLTHNGSKLVLCDL